jgi:prepilin-type N-terminal cleavage/methylation domain-containing protein
MRRPGAVAPFQGIRKHGSSQESRHAFTLIELIGVLAVIAILAALLIPKVFDAISMARMNRAALSMGTIKGAVVEHYAKFGSLASSNGVPLVFTGTYTNFDSILLAEGFIDKPFNPRIGTNAFIRIVHVSGLTAGTDVDGSNGAYDLDGSGNNDVVGAAYTIDAVFLDVPWVGGDGSE